MDFSKDIDIAGAKERFMGNEGLFKKFLFRFPNENQFSQLKQFVEENKAEEAFQAAHTLKGVVGNLSLVSVSEVLNPMVEVLRAGNIPDQAQLDAVFAAYEHSVEVIKYIEDNDVSVF